MEAVLALAEPLLLTAPLTDQQRSATRHALEQLPQRSIFASMIRSTRLGRLFQLPACVSCRAPFFLFSSSFLALTVLFWVIQIEMSPAPSSSSSSSSTAPVRRTSLVLRCAAALFDAALHGSQLDSDGKRGGNLSAAIPPQVTLCSPPDCSLTHSPPVC